MQNEGWNVLASFGPRRIHICTFVTPSVQQQFKLHSIIPSHHRMSWFQEHRQTPALLETTISSLLTGKTGFIEAEQFCNWAECNSRSPSLITGNPIKIRHIKCTEIAGSFKIKVNPFKYFPPPPFRFLFPCIYFRTQIWFVWPFQGCCSAPLPPARGRVPQSSTTPWPSRTETALLIFVLEFSTSRGKHRWAGYQETRNINKQEIHSLKSWPPIPWFASKLSKRRRKGCSARGRMIELGLKGINLQRDNWTDPMANFVLMPGSCYPDFDNQKGANEQDLKIGPEATVSLLMKAMMNTAPRSFWAPISNLK